MTMTTTLSHRQILVPTANEPRHREIDLNHLNERDLSELREEDPFMFHSIPAAHKARISNRPVDVSDLMPRDDENSASSSSPLVVSRKSRLSTERHAGALLEELFASDEFSGPAADLQEMSSEPSELPGLLVELFGADLDDFHDPPSTQ
eukprot:CAMPEP_0172531462 /NCGR_PEP_ID=MMETSP1067-20121228/4865_1 /TAXON_ID=265564 ORGANISM="Thalassiosira punctigera, Strain Tpunct2005C2" /NCGR_SAMPLE_ID=MMETSP1067 /ASSEMBLY_ACC=CAM_ASM_000444 /LENGTH=148 /DNA_ID=CAMNT_0013315847 /DNA_START=60 /DNA_END=506 /DNA_ORIENTATION=+